MNNNKINISTEELADWAGTITEQCDRLNNMYIDFKNKIDKLKTAWEFESGETFAQCVEPAVRNLSEATLFIAEYAKFLNLTVETYEECERKQQAGSSFGG